MDLFRRVPHPVLEPRADIWWANGAVFNPGVWYDEKTVHLLFRALPDTYRRIPLKEPVPLGPKTGFDNYISYIGYATSRDGLSFQWSKSPFIAPDEPFDKYGAEDPRISKIGDTYLITYTALSHPAFDGPDGVRIGLASTMDFRGVTKYGVVGPPVCDKDAVIFPRPINGRIAMLHRLPPDVQLVYFDDLEQLYRPPASLWESHMASIDQHVVMSPRGPGWEEKKVGAGPTPIETEDGWLLIYHGVDRRHVYRTGLVLLDLDDPSIVLSRTSDPVFEPEMEYELYGDVNNVVFPEGAVVIEDVLYMYYGAADRVIGLATAPMSDILGILREAA